MVKAITVKYHGPGNVRGSRLVASDCDGNRVTIPYPDELFGEFCFREAAVALARKMRWGGGVYGALVGGYVGKGTYVYVFLETRLGELQGYGEGCAFVIPDLADVVPGYHALPKWTRELGPLREKCAELDAKWAAERAARDAS